MKRTLLTAALFVAATTCAMGQKDKTAEEQQKDLQGSWAITGTRGYSKELQKDFQGLVITFDGDKIAAKYDGKTAQATCKLILTKAGPSQMDVTVKEGPDAVKGKTFNCIYLLEGNTLKITYRDPGKQRPSTFTDEGEAGVYTVSFKKQKQ